MNDKFDAFFTGLLIGMVGTALIFGIVNRYDVRKLKAEAVKHSAAEWVPDKYGKSAFRWMEPMKIEKEAK